jgi:hypothetical protein
LIFIEIFNITLLKPLLTLLTSHYTTESGGGATMEPDVEGSVIACQTELLHKKAWIPGKWVAMMNKQSGLIGGWA